MSRVKGGLVAESPYYDVFISYSRADNETGWVTGLRDAIYEDFREFSSEPFRIFFDTSEIHSRQDWELRLREGLRSSKVLLICLSPNYLMSPYCRWEFEEFARVQAQRVGGGDAVTGVYFVGLNGEEPYGDEIAAWRLQHQVERIQLEDLQPWFPQGVQALQEAEVRARISSLGQGVHDALTQERLAQQAPGNLRRHNPWFVGRVKEMRQLREHLTGRTVGVLTAVHGIGGMGKTELAVTYAYFYGAKYQGGTWQVDADGHTNMLAAISTLAPEVGLNAAEEQPVDRQVVGRLVLDRLTALTATAGANDPDRAACLLLLDNVSELELLSESQLALLPREPWLHLLATTRLGTSDVGSAGSKASVATIEIGPLAHDDALELIREHQPARDLARLFPDFTSPAEEAAAREIVTLLDGYTLAVEQAAVYLGVTEQQPSELLADLRAMGPAVMDEAVAEESDPADTTAATIRGKIRHQKAMVAVIVDQTLQRLPVRARAALGFAALLPADTVPWDWLRELTTSSQKPPSQRSSLRGLSGHDDWLPAQRILEGRRLLTPANDPRFARLHRVVQEHLRLKLVDAETEQRLEAHLLQAANDIESAARPDTALVAVTVVTLTSRLTQHCDGQPNLELASAGLALIDPARKRLDLTSVSNLATATKEAFEALVARDPAASDCRRNLAINLDSLGDIRNAAGDTSGALGYHRLALHSFEELLSTDHSRTHQRDVAVSLNKVGDMLAHGGDFAAAKTSYMQALFLFERLSFLEPANQVLRRDVAVTLDVVGRMSAAEGDEQRALNSYTEAIGIFEELAAADDTHTSVHRDLAITHTSVAELRRGHGDSQGALDAYTRALDIFEELASADPTHVGYQRDLAVARFGVAELRLARGDNLGALDAYTRSAQTVEKLSEIDPHNERWQKMLAVTRDRLELVRLRADALLPELQVGPWASWEPCLEGEDAEALQRLANGRPEYFGDSTLLSSRWTRLPFYDTFRLMEIQIVRDHVTKRVFVLACHRGVAVLSGTWDPIYAINEAESLELTEATIADYVRFFLYFLRASGGAFVLIESSDQIGCRDEVGDRTEEEGDTFTLQEARDRVRPLAIRGVDEAGRWLVDATVAYKGVLFDVSIVVTPDGTFDMPVNTPIGVLGKLTIPELSWLYPLEPT